MYYSTTDLNLSNETVVSAQNITNKTVDDPLIRSNKKNP